MVVGHIILRTYVSEGHELRGVDPAVQFPAAVGGCGRRVGRGMAVAAVCQPVLARARRGGRNLLWCVVSPVALGGWPPARNGECREAFPRTSVPVQPPRSQQSPGLRVAAL